MCDPFCSVKPTGCQNGIVLNGNRRKEALRIFLLLGLRYLSTNTAEPARKPTSSLVG